jgi:hypothetical protein
MSYETDSAQRYRQRAAELRTIAQSEWAVEMRRTLVAIAEDYEQMAISMDALELSSRKRA